MQKILIIGYLGRDPELKYSPQGAVVAQFSIASTERWKDKNGELQERTEWFGVKAFGRRAEIAGEYLKKGSKVYIEGSLRTHSWDDKQTGQKKYMTEIIVNDLVLLGGRGEGGGESGGGFSRGAASGGNNFDQRTPEHEPAPAMSTPISDEDIPF